MMDVIFIINVTADRNLCRPKHTHMFARGHNNTQIKFCYRLVRVNLNFVIRPTIAKI